MQKHNITRPTRMRKARRVGRGGKRGKTSGSGGKGQTARAGHKVRPEMREIIKKLPKRRGYGTNRSRTVIPRTGAVVTLAALERTFESGVSISPATLAEKGLVRRVGGKVPTIKVLGNEVSKKFALRGVTTSVQARAAIEKVGGIIAP